MRDVNRDRKRLNQKIYKNPEIRGTEKVSWNKTAVIKLACSVKLIIKTAHVLTFNKKEMCYY